MDEMESLKSSMDARARRDKKKKAKIKAKERQRAAIGLHGQDEEGATQTGEMDLFSLARIKSKAGLDSVSKAEAPGVDAAYDSDDEIEEMAKHDDDFEYDPDLDGDGADNQKRLESELDMLYEEYKTRHKKRGPSLTPSRRRVEPTAWERSARLSAPVNSTRTTTPTSTPMRMPPRCAPKTGPPRRRLRRTRRRTLC